jgi:tetratricopeptide (TPR) repeat protein
MAFITAILLGPVDTAHTYFEAGQYHAAIETLMTAQRMAPDDGAINYWLERSYYEERNYDLAVVHGEQAIKSSPQNAEYHRWLGRAYGAKAEQSHSFFLARKVKKAFEMAVTLDPLNISARRDLMEYLVEAPWIVGGDKDKAKQQIEFINKLDPIEGRLAQAAFFSAEKKWKEAQIEYLAALDQRPGKIDAYMEAADFFSDRKDADHLQHALDGASGLGIRDPRLDFYRAVALLLRRVDLSSAEALLRSYLNVPERSDYPSHKAALTWLRAAQNQVTFSDLKSSEAVVEDPKDCSSLSARKRV